MGRIIKFPYALSVSVMPAHRIELGIVKALIIKVALKYDNPSLAFWKEAEEVIATVIPDMLSWSTTEEEKAHKVVILTRNFEGKYEYGLWIEKQFFSEEFR